MTEVMTEVMTEATTEVKTELMPEVDRYAVLGNPVAHSRSPRIHALFAAQTRQALSYERVLCALEGAAPGQPGFADTARAFAQAGGRGCNITMPFKFEALALAAQGSPRAVLAGAANVLRFDATGWLADNTDGVGLLQDIQAGAGHNLAGQRVLLVGAGGAAAGVLGALLAARPAAVVVANRSAAKAQALVARHAAWAAQHGCALQACGLMGDGWMGDGWMGSNLTAQAHPLLSAFDVVINASASSLAGAASPVPASVLAPGCLAVDLMYGPDAQPWLAWAARHGARPRDGLGMLVEQAAEAFAWWRGVRPSTAPVLQALRAELAA
jgi:shikimate dehydrogenase